MKNTEYLIKHKNEDVALFSIDKNLWLIHSLEILNEQWSPVNTSTDKGYQAQSLNQWLDNRCIPNSRDGIERLKSVYSVTEMKDLMIVQLGLSLSDHYWIAGKDSRNLDWNTINYFDNPYSKEFGSIVLDEKFKKGKQGDSSPNPSLNGALKKFWLKKDGVNYLVKTGHTNSSQEVFNEYYASLLLDNLKFDHVPYNLVFQNDMAMNVCTCFIDKDTEFMCGNDIVRKYGINKTYEGFIAVCEKMSLPYAEKGIGQTIAADYLIDNSDRHWNNFGIIRDSNTGKWLRVVPNFDNGNSLWYNQVTISANEPSHSSSFETTNTKNLKHINLRQYVKESHIGAMVDIFDKAFDQYGDVKRKALLRKSIADKQKVVIKLLESRQRDTHEHKNSRGRGR